MVEVSTVGLDLAKRVFHVHGEDGSGAKIFSRPLTRSQLEPFFQKLERCVVAMEACSSAYHWARRLQAMGHRVALIPPIYVKPFVVRNKNDARDAEGICRAAQRPGIRTVPVKTEAQQASGALHRVRDLLVRQRTQAANQIRGLAAEFGLIAPLGPAGFKGLLEAIDASALPAPAGLALAAQARHWATINTEIKALEATIVAEARACPATLRLMGVPGVGPLTAHALVANLPDMTIFRSGRDLAAWLGLTRKDRSTGGRAITSGSISKRGNKTLRRLLVLGATARLSHERRKKAPDPWLAGLLAKKAFRVVAVAQAAKTARIVWALLIRGEAYQPNHRPRLAA